MALPLLVLVPAMACGPTPHQGTGAVAPPGDQVVVASFNFPESELLAEIYAQALRARGVPARTELDLGTREMVMPAFQEGLVDVVPEYLGSALEALAPGSRSDMSQPVAVTAALNAALSPWHGRVLTPSPAQNQNGLVVTRARARRYGLRTVSDLRKLSGGLVLTGPPECPGRPYCLAGFRGTYGLRVKGFLALDSGGQRVTALHEGVADVAVMFSTDAQLASGDLVFLSDDRHLQPAENVAPLVSDRALAQYGPRLSTTLDLVSKHLSTSGLVFLNYRVAVEAKPVATEAYGWLVRHGLAARSAQPGSHVHLP